MQFAKKTEGSLASGLKYLKLAKLQFVFTKYAAKWLAIKFY
jgi:hypothetical protein